MNIAALLLWICIFIYKLPIFSFAGSSVRPEDFLIGIIIPFLAITYQKVFVTIPKYLSIFMMFVCFSIVSAAVNASLGRVDFVTSAVFAVRQIEYMLFFFVGRILFKKNFQFDILAYSYIVYSFVISILISSNVIPRPIGAVADRWGANTSGPFEYAVVLAIMSSFLILGPSKRYWRSKTPIFLLGMFSLYMTQSRITLVSLIFVLRNFLLRKSVIRQLTITALILSPAIASAAFFIVSSHAVSESAGATLSRFQTSSDVDILERVVATYPTIRPPKTSKEYIEGAFTTLGGDYSAGSDISAYIRFYRWAVLIKAVTADYATLIVGLGPGFGTSAVDGNYVRILVEDGLTGVLLLGLFFTRLIKELWESSKEFQNILIIMLVSAIFIDILESLRPMILLWSYVGYLDERKKLAVNQIKS